MPVGGRRNRYQRGHLYDASDPCTFDSIKPSCVTEFSRVPRSHRALPKDRKHYPAKSKPVQLLCEDCMRKVNTATVPEPDMTGAQFWERHSLPYWEEVVRQWTKSFSRARRLLA